MRISKFRALAFVVGSLAVALAAPQSAESAASGTTEPRLDMPVSLSVAARTPTIDVVLPSVTGDVECTAEFRVEGNTPRVRMFAETTALYYNGDPGSQAVPPIPLDDSGVDIDAQGATSQGPNGTSAAYVGSGDMLDVFPTRKTEEIIFLSSDAYTFVHAVFVTVKWQQEDPNKPAGQYRGKIKLTCMADAPL